MPTKEEIIKYYIEENHKYYDTINYFGLKELEFLKLCKEYKIEKKRKNLKDMVEGKSSKLNVEEIINFYNNHSYDETL